MSLRTLKTLRGAPLSVASVLFSAVSDSNGCRSRWGAAVPAWGRAVRIRRMIRARVAIMRVGVKTLRFMVNYLYLSEGPRFAAVLLRFAAQDLTVIPARIKSANAITSAKKKSTRKNMGSRAREFLEVSATTMKVKR